MKTLNEKLTLSDYFILVTFAVICGLLIVVTINYLGYKEMYEIEKEISEINCEIIALQSELLKESFPVYVDEACNDIRDIGVLDNGTKDYLCQQFLDIKIPEVNCEELTQ